MSAWRLVPQQAGAALRVPPGRAVVLGRGSGCDLTLDDDTISRRHAELSAGPGGLVVRDLASSNGVRVNGVRVGRFELAEQDLVSFGALVFRVERAGIPAGPGGSAGPDAPIPDTIVRAVDARSGGSLARLADERMGPLLSIARRLSGTVELDALLALIVEQAAALLPVDRVALLLDDGAGELRTAHARHRLGDGPVEVPRSIARQAFETRCAVTTEHASADPRFQSGSVIQSQVRAALCVPLLADDNSALGVLYVDSLTSERPFSERDAALGLAFGGLAAVSLAKAHFAEAARRGAVARANFERFFAPGVASRIAAQQSGVRPGGERRAVTVLYSDVRGFTGLAESLPPEAVAAQLSEYFAAMVEVVFAQGGTLDKFIGDALLAVWGAPFALSGDADRAVAAAQSMHGEVAALNRRWRETGQPELGVGIGLHYGEAFTGTIGSPRRLEYTVIGDVVNVAARLCGAAAAGEVMVSEAFKSQLAATLAWRPAEPLLLRGREAAVIAYRLGGEAANA